MALVLALLTCGIARAEIVIRFTHTVAENAPKGEAANLFRDKVNRRLRGRVRIEVYPDSALYNDTAAMKALLLGDVQMAAPAIAKLGQYSRKTGLFDLPFLFDNTDAIRCFFHSEGGKIILDDMQSSGLKGLSYWLHGMKQLAANIPIRLPRDIAGKRFRIMDSDVLERQFIQLNAIPMRAPFNQVFGSLKAGVVDGHENTWANLYTKRLHELTKYISETNHGALEYMVITSVDFWDSLPSDIRAALEQILHEVSVEMADIAVRKADRYRWLIAQSDKVKLIALSAQEIRQWKEQTYPLWDQFRAEIGDELIAAAQNCDAGRYRVTKMGPGTSP